MVTKLCRIGPLETWRSKFQIAELRLRQRGVPEETARETARGGCCPTPVWLGSLTVLSEISMEPKDLELCWCGLAATVNAWCIHVGTCHEPYVRTLPGAVRG